MATMDSKGVVVTVKDNTPTTPLTLVLKLGDGFIKWVEKINYIKDLNRGVIDDELIRKGDEEFCTLDIECFVEHFISRTGEALTPYEVFTKTGEASAWVSTGAACTPYAVDLELVYTPPCGTVYLDKAVFSKFRPEDINFDLKTSKLMLKGFIPATKPTYSRVAPT